MSELFANPTMRLFAVCAGILVLKMQLTVYVTTVLRNVKKVYVSPEDYAFWGRAPGAPDEQIERVRRAHRNDLESILPFLAVGFLAAASGAVSYDVAWWLFVPFTGARILHTIAYAFGLQPWRSIFFGIADVALLITTVLLLRALL
jgi:microsomal prostaglandin-E synthase 1